MTAEPQGSGASAPTPALDPVYRPAEPGKAFAPYDDDDALVPWWLRPTREGTPETP
jgi:hypothetical protein